MKKHVLNLMPFLLGLLGVVCIVAFNFIGSTVTLDGTLVEPFFLIPLAYMFFFVCLVSLLIKFLFSYLSNKK